MIYEYRVVIDIPDILFKDIDMFYGGVIQSITSASAKAGSKKAGELAVFAEDRAKSKQEGQTSIYDYV